MNIPPYGDNNKRIGAYFSNLQVSAQIVPNLTVKISAGGFWYYTSDGAVYVEYNGGSSPAIQLPLSGAKWVIIAISQNGVITIIDGLSGSDPDLPQLPGRGRIPLAAIYLQASPTTQVITNDIIFDIRPLFPLEVRDHRDLEGSDQLNLHPIGSISNLSDTLDTLATTDELTLELAEKANVDGTDNISFTLNKSFSGVPGSDCFFRIKRGTEDDVALKWNEGTEQWQYTNDGTLWYNFADSFLNDGTQELKIKTYTQGTEPTLSASQSMALWINSSNSSRVYLIYRRGADDQVKIELT